RPKFDGKTVVIRTLMPEFHEAREGDLSCETTKGPIHYVARNSSWAYVRYDISGPHTSNWKFEAVNRDNIYNEELEVYKDISPFAYILRDQSYQFTHQRIIQGCETKSCVILKTSDIVYFFQ